MGLMEEIGTLRFMEGVDLDGGDVDFETQDIKLPKTARTARAAMTKD
jgi:hypothetical protein